jgi:hypothetical protein
VLPPRERGTPQGFEQENGEGGDIDGRNHFFARSRGAMENHAGPIVSETTFTTGGRDGGEEDDGG